MGETREARMMHWYSCEECDWSVKVLSKDPEYKRCPECQSKYINCLHTPEGSEGVLLSKMIGQWRFSFRRPPELDDHGNPVTWTCFVCPHCAKMQAHYGYDGYTWHCYKCHKVNDAPENHLLAEACRIGGALGTAARKRILECVEGKHAGGYIKYGRCAKSKVS